MNNGSLASASGDIVRRERYPPLILYDSQSQTAEHVQTVFSMACQYPSHYSTIRQEWRRFEFNVASVCGDDRRNAGKITTCLAAEFADRMPKAVAEAPSEKVQRVNYWQTMLMAALGRILGDEYTKRAPDYEALIKQILERWQS